MNVVTTPEQGTSGVGQPRGPSVGQEVATLTR